MNPSPKNALKGGLAALVLFLGLAWFTPLDLALARAAYSEALPHWPLGDAPLFKFLYDYGQPPALIAGLLGLLAFFASFLSPARRHWRGPGIYLFLVLALGPGLLVNTLGKGLAGRPRPADLAEFGGMWEFRRALDFGLAGRGRSFLSGHASMAFFWFAFYFIARAKAAGGWGRVGDGGRADGWNGRAATRAAPTNPGGVGRWIFVGVAALGALMGAARVLQGGHFASDVALCGVGMWLVCALLSPLIGWQPGAGFFRMPWVRPAIAAFLVSWGMLATPVYEERHFLFGADAAPTPMHRVVEAPRGRAASLTLELALAKGDIAVDFKGGGGEGLPLALSGYFQGFALGRGREELVQQPFAPPQGWPLRASDAAFSFTQALGGRFWRARGDYRVSLPASTLAEARLKSAGGRITIAPLPQGRRTVVYGDLPASRLPAGFEPYGAKASLREGADPLLVLVLDSKDIHFQRE